MDLFSIPPHQLEREFRLKRLYILKINRLNSYIFQYEPIIKIFNYKFPDDIIKVNQEKYERINNVKYDSINEFYTENIDENGLHNKFRYYLDESYRELQASDFILDEDDFASDNLYNNQRGRYEPDDNNHNDWLRDVAGTDDPEFMNDVYWNLD